MARLRLRKKYIVIGVIILIIIGGFAVRRNVINSKNESKQTATVKRGTVEEELILAGTVLADEDISLQFKTAGLLTYVNVKEGEQVKKGQTVAKIDSRDLGIALQQARNTLRAKEAALEEIYDEVKDHSNDETFVQKNTRTTAEVAKDNAYDAVRAAEQAFVGTTLTSPIEGIAAVVTNPFPGVNISPTTTKYEIINPDTIYFSVAADQTEVTQINQNQKVKIILDPFTEKTYEGQVKLISFTPDESESGTIYKVKVQIENANLLESGVRIGMTGDARFQLAKSDNTLYVPINFVKSDDQGKYIYLKIPRQQSVYRNRTRRRGINRNQRGYKRRRHRIRVIT